MAPIIIGQRQNRLNLRASRRAAPRWMKGGSVAGPSAVCNRAKRKGEVSRRAFRRSGNRQQAACAFNVLPHTSCLRPTLNTDVEEPKCRQNKTNDSQCGGFVSEIYAVRRFRK
jgi:hypothetical protein